LSDGDEWGVREDRKRSSTFVEMLAGRLELTSWMSALTLKIPLCPAVRWTGQENRNQNVSSPWPCKQEIGAEAAIRAPDNPSIVDFIRKKPPIFF